MDRDWRIVVSGEWFYGTREACIREREEFESTFTDEDWKDHEPVVPERIYSEVPLSVAEVKRYRFKGAAGEYVYSVDFDKAQAALTKANSDKEAYAQNAIDLRRRLEEAIEMLYETSMAHSRIEKILIK